MISLEWILPKHERTNKTRFLPLVIIFVLFLITLWIGMYSIGPQIATVGILYVAMTAWLYGYRVGFAAAALNDFLTILTIFHFHFEDSTLLAKVVGTAMPFIAAAFVGSIHNLYMKLKETETLLRIEHEKSELLLSNIFPKKIVDRLKNGEVLIADRYQDSTILFSDLVGFSHLSKTMPPQRLVQLLDKIITNFDQLSEKFQVEKIKTIGDGYLVVSGIPDENKQHASAVCQMALAMLESVEQLNKDNDLHLQIRIGIHSGPVIGGVIGPKKFTFDLWGDTVNLANRLESQGIPGQIHISHATYKLIEHEFNVVPRDPINIKGYGAIATYFLNSRIIDKSSIQSQ